MQIDLSQLSPIVLAEWIVASILAIATFAVWYHFIYTVTKRNKKRVQSAHFYPLEFVHHSLPTNFDPYNKKWGKIALVALVLVFASILIPVAAGLQPPLNVFGLLLGIVFSLWQTTNWMSNMDKAEIQRNSNTTCITMHALFPEEGEFGLNIKGAEVESEATLSQAQTQVIVEAAIEGLKKLPAYDVKKIVESELMKIWLERLEGLIAVRILARGDHIILITRHSFNMLKTHKAVEIIDETIQVKVPLAPMFTYYVGPSVRVFRTINEKGSPIFEDRIAGVFIDFFDLAQRDEFLLGGGYIAPTYADSLLGQYIHLLEQNFQSATSMTNTEVSLDKANADVDDKQVDSDAEGIVSAGKKLMKLTEDIEKGSHEPISLGKWARIAFMIGLIAAAAVIGFVVHDLVFHA